MSSLPTSVTLPVTGTPPSSTTFGIPVKQSVDYLLNQPYTLAYLGAAQTLTAATAAVIVLNSETEDSDGMHGVTGTFTVVTPGVYWVTGQIMFPSTSSGHDAVSLQYNGSTTLESNLPPLAVAHRYQASGPMRCAVGDTITLSGFSTTGGALTTGAGNTFMSALWVRK